MESAATMPVRLVVAVTDSDWFDHLRRQSELAEVNFWSPSPRSFQALTPGELFLFKLHAPIDMIVGGGVFAFAKVMPLFLAWEAFGPANGAASLAEMRRRIMRYRRPDDGSVASIEIGCRILTQPFFLPESRWFRPPSWSRNIVSFRGYTTDDQDGMTLWNGIAAAGETFEDALGLSEPPARYGEPTLIRPRLGQGAFRLIVTDLYRRRCAVTGERTLPALEAAHIRPYANGGEHAASNGILMRRDVHSLFDAGYVTVTPDHCLEVSRRIREEFENGRDYYAMHGTRIALPDHRDAQPDPSALQWHNENCFLG
jgi:putative restriction endonuclease